MLRHSHSGASSDFGIAALSAFDHSARVFKAQNDGLEWGRSHAKMIDDSGSNPPFSQEVSEMEQLAEICGSSLASGTALGTNPTLPISPSKPMRPHAQPYGCIYSV